MARLYILLLFFVITASTYADLAFPPYPNSLLEKQWNKDIDIEDVEGDQDDEARQDKQIIGDYLKNIKKLYKKINFRDYDPLMNKRLQDWNVYSLAEFEAIAHKNAKSNPGKLRKKVKLLLIELKKIQKQWKKGKVVSENDQKDLAEILATLKGFSEKLEYKGKRGLKKRLARVFADTRNRMARRAQTAWTGLSSIVKDLQKDAKTINVAKYEEYVAKAPIMKKAISVVFGSDSNEYTSFEKEMISVNSDKEAQAQAKKILKTLQSIIVSNHLKNLGIE